MGEIIVSLLQKLSQYGHAESVTYFAAGIGGFLLGLYVDVPVAAWTLMVLMVLDIICGLGAAYITGTLNSDASFHGLVRKTMILLLVLACSVITQVLPKELVFPAGSLASSFFCLHEFISILENIKRAGVAPPEYLETFLGRFRRPAADERRFLDTPPTAKRSETDAERI